jgi:hypothetical protein
LTQTRQAQLGMIFAELRCIIECSNARQIAGRFCLMFDDGAVFIRDDTIEFYRRRIAGGALKWRVWRW